MPVAKRFLFDNYFDADERGVTAARDFTLEDVEDARRQGFAEGKTLGREEVQASINQQVADAVAAASKALQSLGPKLEEVRISLENEGLRTVAMIISKIVPHYARKHGLEEIEALIHECLCAAYDEPRIVVRAHASILEPLSNHLEGLTRASGFNGNVVLLEDPSLSPGDCRVEWAEGGAERDTARVWKSIETAITRFTGDLPDLLPGSVAE
jgi:flagellar assembly protein FliH